jgi:hypothetical protein
MNKNVRNVLFVNSVLGVGLLMSFGLYQAALDISVESGSIVQKIHTPPTVEPGVFSRFTVLRKFHDMEPERWSIVVEGLDSNNRPREVEVNIDENEWHALEEGDFWVIK